MNAIRLLKNREPKVFGYVNFVAGGPQKDLLLGPTYLFHAAAHHDIHRQCPQEKPNPPDLVFF